MPMNALFLDPVDILLFRGNRLFGEPGSHGDALVPPWPSVVAGALRSRMLVDEGIDLTRFAANQIDHPELGSPAQPGRSEERRGGGARTRRGGTDEVQGTTKATRTGAEQD